MKEFMGEDFLLSTETARRLYHDCAKKLPILDYHCHIDPQEIAKDRKFDNIAQAWLGGDHYKWRQMRANGVEERYITGAASDREKFQKWAETLEMAAGNPLYHWSHLELRRYFGYTGHLNGKTAEEVWNLCNEKLRQDDSSARGLILQSGVTLLCTTDDPADSLKWHTELAKDRSFPVQALPAFRPDRAMHLAKKDYLSYLERLGEASGIVIASFEELVEALRKRMDVFDSLGCRIADHGLPFVMYRPHTAGEVEAAFARRLQGREVGTEEELMFQTALLLAMGREYRARNWVMQLHFGCRRDNNAAAYARLGADSGFDCIGSPAPVSQLASFLDALNTEKQLPKTILYSLNPDDDARIASLLGCFPEERCAGKMQQGSAWWFNDHKEGMAAQMKSLASLNLLGNFIGMLTDSRSFLSYTRHEYFRRILCDLLGGWVENGEYPADGQALEKIVKGICYNNAVRYFGFDLQEV